MREGLCVGCDAEERKLLSQFPALMSKALSKKGIDIPTKRLKFEFRGEIEKGVWEADIILKGGGKQDKAFDDMVKKVDDYLEGRATGEAIITSRHYDSKAYGYRWVMRYD